MVVLVALHTWMNFVTVTTGTSTTKGPMVTSVKPAGAAEAVIVAVVLGKEEAENVPLGKLELKKPELGKAELKKPELGKAELMKVEALSKTELLKV